MLSCVAAPISRRRSDSTAVAVQVVNFVPRVALGELSAHGDQAHHASKAVDLPPFAIAPLDPVEKLGCLFVRKHHADITRRNQRRPGGVKFVAFDKRRAFV